MGLKVVMRTGIVIKPNVWMYQENRKDIIDEIFMGWAVGILGEKEGWLEVLTHYGYHGYIEKGGVCFCGRECLRQRDERKKTAVVIRGFVDVMAEATVRGKVLCTLQKGSFFEILERAENGYQKISFACGQEGYVPRISCMGRKDDDGYLYEAGDESYFLRQGLKRTRFEQEVRRGLISCAKSYLGTQYRWAGKSMEGIDCSGFTFMCYLMNGIIIYRDAEMKSGYPVHKILTGQAKEGDLLYFPGHIAMYLGNGKYIHATGNEASFGCVVNSLLKKDADYRSDLAESLLAAGSVWQGESLCM